MQDLKTGHLLGASPKAQFYGQMIGSFASVFIASGLRGTVSLDDILIHSSRRLSTLPHCLHHSWPRIPCANCTGMVRHVTTCQRTPSTASCIRVCLCFRTPFHYLCSPQGTLSVQDKIRATRHCVCYWYVQSTQFYTRSCYRRIGCLLLEQGL